MLVLQAGFLQDQLVLWAEADVSSNGNSNRKRKAKPEAPPLPFAASAAALTDVADVFPALAGRADVETVTVWLPTVANQPVASNPLIAEPPALDAASELQPWSISALPLAYSQALDLLSACTGKEVLRPGVLVGKTLAYWSAVMRFAGALVAREQFLPALQEEHSAIRALWQPVLTAAEAPRLHQLVQAMPAACRALGRGDAAPDTPAQSVVSAVVRNLVDALVRSTVALPAPLARRAPKSRKVDFDSIHDAWLHALRSSDGLLEHGNGERTRLIEQIDEWRRPITLATAAPFRLCFRLEEPPEPNGEVKSKKASANSDHWRLRFLLQAADDPSLLVPVEEAWKKTAKNSPLQRNGFEPREYLLTALGQASSVYPSIEESLKVAAPSSLTLDTQGAYTFLTEKAWLLEQAGFGVLLPAWWTRKGTKQRLSLRAETRSSRAQSGSLISLDSLVDFDWQVALGDETLTLAELEALAKLKAPLVRVRGQWVQMSAEEIQAALAFWRKKGTGEVPLRQLLQMALGAAAPTGGLAFAGVHADGWIRDFLDQLEGQREFELLPPPAEFEGELRPYQERGYSWLGFLRRWGLGACLADDMGLGKTVQTLALLERDWEEGDRRPTLLICPMSVVGNWQKEAERFTPGLPVMVHHGLKRVKGPAFKAQAETHALVLSSYALLHRDMELFNKVRWRGIILDEAQNVKNPDTKQARAARSLPAEYRIALTGTPVENHVGDLWSIMEFLNPGFLGSQAEFRRNFLLPIQASQDPEASRKLQRLTGPFVLRRLKTDKTIIADLPDKLEMKVFCNLTKEQASLYQAVVEDANRSLADLEPGIKRRGAILGMLSKLKQVCNHPAQFLGDNSAIPGRSGKLARLTEMLEEVLEVGDRALIFTQFTEMGGIIKRHLQETFGREVLFLHGGLTKKQRDRQVERFQGSDGNGSADRPQLFLLSLKAGGTGLNLTAAQHVFHFDRWWNPAVEDQATDRAFRIGQKRNVQVHKFLCVGTLEERIDEMIERKQDIARKVVGSGENWLTELSNAQLKDLFALRQEALAE